MSEQETRPEEKEEMGHFTFIYAYINILIEKRETTKGIGADTAERILDAAVDDDQ